jgi:anti-anti-sigma regulatory factor
VTATHPGPALTETVDPVAGRVRVSGHLTLQGADLLRGTVESLRRLGHTSVLVDLAGVRTVDPGALHLLHALQRGEDGSPPPLILTNAG